MSNNLIDEWHKRGASNGTELIILTDYVYSEIKKIGPGRPLHDSMDYVETALQTFTEATAQRLHVAHDSQGFDELQADARQAGKVGGLARRAFEEETGLPVVNSVNYKTLRQARQRELQPLLFADDQDSE